MSKALSDMERSSRPENLAAQFAALAAANQSAPDPAPDSTVGRKDDAGKNRVDLFPLAALSRTSAILTFGANKYAAHNWKKGIAYHRLYRAALNHLMDWFDGHDPDHDSGRSHLDHAACCIAFLQHYEAYPDVYRAFDDRVGIKGEVLRETHALEPHVSNLRDEGASQGRADGSDQETDISHL